MANMKKTTIPQRIPTDMLKDIEKALDVRYKNNLIKRKDLNIVEGLRLARRAPEWKSILKKLEKQPRREDVRRQNLF